MAAYRHPTAADDAYLGRTLRVTGRALVVEPDWLALDTPTFLVTVDCMLAASERGDPAWADQILTVEGIGAGRDALGRPELHQCRRQAPD